MPHTAPLRLSAPQAATELVKLEAARARGESREWVATLAAALVLTVRGCGPLRAQLLSDGFLLHALGTMERSSDALLPVAAELMRGCTPAQLLPFAARLAPVVALLSGADDTDAHAALLDALEALACCDDCAERDELVGELLRLGLPAVLLGLLARETGAARPPCVNMLRVLSSYGAHAERVLAMLSADAVWGAHADMSHELYVQAPTGLLTYHHQ